MKTMTIQDDSLKIIKLQKTLDGNWSQIIYDHRHSDNCASLALDMQEVEQITHNGLRGLFNLIQGLYFSGKKQRLKILNPSTYALSWLTCSGLSNLFDLF